MSALWLPAALIGVCVLGWGQNGQGAGPINRQDEPRRMLLAENIAIPETTIDRWVRKVLRDRDLVKRPALSARTDPILKIEHRVIGRGGNGHRLAKANSDLNKLSWRFPMIIDLQFKLACRLSNGNHRYSRPCDCAGNSENGRWFGSVTDDLLGLDTTTRNVRTLDLRRVNEQLPGRPPQGAGETCQHQSKCGDQKFKAAVMLADIPKVSGETANEKADRGGLILFTFIGGCLLVVVIVVTLNRL